MRTIDITYARLLETPQTSFSLATGEGAITVRYTVGSQTPAVTNDDGSVSGPIQTDHPTAALQSSATVPLGPTDTAGAKLRELIMTIAAQEGLQLAPDGTDQVITS